MNESQVIEAAIERRFSRAAIPDVPRGPWCAKTAHAARPHAAPRRFAYAGAVLGILVTAGITAQASGALPAAYARLIGWNGSSKPLPPLIHAADRLTIAQAQQQTPFTIVIPAGLPPNTTLQYAAAGREHLIPRVALNYQTVIGGRYYRIIITETTVASGPPVGRFAVGRIGQETWTVPLRRWRHGAIVMEILPAGLPPAVVDRIVRENTR